MRLHPPKDAFLTITTKEMIGRASGIILQKEALSIMKAVEAHSTRENFEHGGLFQPTESAFEKLKISMEVALEHLWQIIDYGIATQLFEIRYNLTTSQLDFIPFVVSVPEGIPTMEDAFHRLLKRSSDAVKKFATDKRTLNDEAWRSILLKISDPHFMENFTEGDEIDSLLDPKSFPYPPSLTMLRKGKELIIEELDSEVKLVVIPHIGIYSLLDNQAQNFLNIAYELFVAKIEPLAKSFDMGLRDRIEEMNLEIKETLSSSDINEIELIRKRMDIYLAYEPILKEKGYYRIVKVIRKLCDVAFKTYESDKKVELDKLLRVYLTMLESSFDFDSRLLRINLEKDSKNDMVIIDQLRKNPKVLSAEWHDADAKMAIFTLKLVSSIKEINSLIYENYRFTTEHILYLKAIVEANESEIKSVFKDEEFLKLYGRNLQAVYFKYIPWFYKLFYFLGITPLVNSGYAKAKSILVYSQMDRQFLYEKRKENAIRKKIKEKEEKIEKDKKIQNKRVLVQALEEAFFIKGTVPTVEWIQANYPIFTLEVLEKMIPDFAFHKFPNKPLADDSILSFPDAPEFEFKNKRLKDSLNRWIRGEDPIAENLVPRLLEIRNTIHSKI
ncbi:hypothetical protein [Leptospira idonii]|uniref:Exonuclease n=1 Tax=Leptospira idonii TaxID=1193500 RepID=A0A4R9M160_9LEPT|nr:hypothetical protein [Leptospira idonii]TGN19555.1 hypothetical protein EHS15_07135 [Leptospira idonii]